MTPAQQKLIELLRRYELIQQRLQAALRSDVEVNREFWNRLAEIVAEALRWADLNAAAMMRYSATREPTKVTTSKWSKILGANAWFAEHAAKSHAVIDWRAKEIAKAEKIVFESRREATRAQEAMIDPAWPDYRIDRFRRDQIGEIVQVSQQIELTVPMIDAAFPYAEYVTRDDRRVRPTHAAMNGFVALRTWEDWPVIRPKNGWNCRCRLVYRTRRQAIDRGWMTDAGKAKFVIKWPNPAARQFYENGNRHPEAQKQSELPKRIRYQVFPDPGWRGPKEWSFPKPRVVEKT